MLYTILSQKYGALNSLFPEEVKDELLIEFEGAVTVPPLTVKLVNGNGVPFLRGVEEGKCSFPRRALIGKISVSLISAQGSIPCTPLIAVQGENAVTVVPDATEVFSRLARVEKNISSLLAAWTALEEKYNALESRIAKLFDGYNI